MSTNSSEPTSVADEIAAMRRIVGAMDKLDPAAQDRVVTWLCQRYAVELPPVERIGGV